MRNIGALVLKSLFSYKFVLKGIGIIMNEEICEVLQNIGLGKLGCYNDKFMSKGVMNEEICNSHGY